MKYNSKYDRWFTKGGLVFKYDSKQDKLILCKQYDNGHGYKYCSFQKGFFSVHRAIYETFVGEIPLGYQIDHINTARDDNRVENLRVVTRSENMLNPITRKRSSDVRTNKPHKKCAFGNKYFEHFGYGRKENPNQYNKEWRLYRKYGRCSWE